MKLSSSQLSSLGFAACLALNLLPQAGSARTKHQASTSATQTNMLQVNPETGETQAQFAARTAWWREAKFGMFIHWGVYAVPADGEWHMNNHKMQVADYEKYAPQFNPVNFDAHRWVQVAKDAGMKYIVITSKHHDGFSMFDSKLTNYSITKATPFRRDPMKELAAECKKQGIKFCFYHSIMDWHHPDYLPRRAWETETRPADGANFNRYIDYMKGELRELLTNYGPIGVIWFDGGWEHTPAEQRSLEVVKWIRQLQPGILINNRTGLPEDFDTPEQSIPASALAQGRLWETCMTLNNNWGYNRNDHNWKSPEDLVHKLCDIASKGGNFLLNVGPTDMGEIPQESITRLARVGQWMKVNGPSVYGTTKSPFKKLSFDGRCTTKGNTLYVQVFNWPNAGLRLQGLKTRVTRARALEGGARLAILHNADSLTIARPAHLDPLATVIELRLAGPAEVEESLIAPGANGSLALTATDAVIQGGANVETKADNIPNIGSWVDQKDTASWRIKVPQAGDYHVELEYACPPDTAGSTYRIGADGAPNIITGTVEDTGGWDKFETKTLPGTLHLPAGSQTLRVTVESMPHGAVMNLRRIILRPA